MIRINKTEAKYLRSIDPKIHITKTRHKLYVEEIKSVLEKLPNNFDAINALKERYSYNLKSDFETWC